MRYVLLIVATFYVSIVHAQIPKKIIVEHFTNTRCVTCHVKNPALYNNLANFPDVIHLAIHPGAPFEECIFFRANEVDNDARTNFYGIYGSTPRLVIQGEEQDAGVNFFSANLITKHENEMSDFEMSITQEFTSVLMDSIRITVNIKRVAASSITSARLYAALAEAEVEYDAPNGESTHLDVFRSSFFGESGEVVELPASVDEEMSYSETIPISSNWNVDEMYTLALIQHIITSSVLQVESAEGQEILGVEQNPVQAGLNIYPNPFRSELTIDADQIEGARVMDPIGKTVYSSSAGNKQLNLEHLSPGAYILEVETRSGTSFHRIVRSSN